MKKILAAAFLLLLLCGLAAAEENLQVYPVPEGTPCEDVWFEVTVNGSEAGVYSDYNFDFEEINFTYFNFRPGTEVDVAIKPLFAFAQVEILPADDKLEWEVTDKVIHMHLNEPGGDYSFVFDGRYQSTTLHVFTNPIDEDEQKIKSAFTTIYFGPGYHDFGGKQIKLTSGMTMYVAAGAVVNAPIAVEYAENVKICGSGIIMMDKINADNPQYGNIVICFNHAKHVSLSGVIAHTHKNQIWTTHVYFCDDVDINNYHVVSGRYASVDALDISNSQNVTVTDCFLRSCDDCITIKGLAGTQTPAEAPANEHIHVSGCTLWNDCNNAMVIGEESMAAYYDDITFRDIDVLYSYDDRDNHEKLDERAVMSIVTLHGTYIRNILWEDIRVNNCQRLICFNFKSSFWFGSIQGNQTFPGGISGVTLRNISCKSPNTGKIANEILMRGWSDDKLVEDVLFDNVIVNGTRILGLMNPYMKINQYTKNIRFK